MISTSDLVSSLLTEARDRADRRLDTWAARISAREGGVLGEAVAYALRSPGKRIRAALALASYRWAGGNSDGIDGVPQDRRLRGFSRPVRTVSIRNAASGIEEGATR